MKWTIEVRPTDERLASWVWTAERADGETVRAGGGPTKEQATENARAEVRVIEAAFTTIAANTTIEEYTPTAAEILAAQ